MKLTQQLQPVLLELANLERSQGVGGEKVVPEQQECELGGTGGVDKPLVLCLSLLVLLLFWDDRLAAHAGGALQVGKFQ